MSEPVLNADVEDVLSSIRRLVSEDKRPLQTKAKPLVADRLVLTPALRVEGRAEDHDQESQPDIAIEDQRDWSSQDAALNAGQISEKCDFTADMLRPGDSTAAKENVAEATAGLLEPDTNDTFGQDQNVAGRSPELDTASDNSAQSFRAELDDFEDEPVPGSFELEDDTDKSTEGSAAYHPNQSAPSYARTADLSDPTVADDAKAATLSAKIEALETAIGNIADTWEPDSAGGDDYSGTEPLAMTWQDDTPAEPTDRGQEKTEAAHTESPDQAAFFHRAHRPTAKPAVEPSSVPPETDKYREDALDLPVEDQMLDEDALRDLISEIVREELQGALGERITRNVRKLVRREIHRALTAQDLE